MCLFPQCLTAPWLLSLVSSSSMEKQRAELLTELYCSYCIRKKGMLEHINCEDMWLDQESFKLPGTPVTLVMSSTSDWAIQNDIHSPYNPINILHSFSTKSSKCDNVKNNYRIFRKLGLSCLLGEGAHF